MTLPYLIQLGNRLQEGLTYLDDDRRQRHSEFVWNQQNSDGGFSGREGDSDLYYSSFAVRTLAMLGQLNPDSEESRKLISYLVSEREKSTNVIDILNWISMAVSVQALLGKDLLGDSLDSWRDQVIKTFEAVRTDDGGYAKSEEGAKGSTYHTFLVLLASQLIGIEIPDSNKLIQFIYDRQRDDGGFCEIAPMRRSGTNPTAAAVATLQIYEAMDDELREDVCDFLLSVRGSEGGFQANNRIPFSDGLSTFTAMLTAQDLGLFKVLKPDAALSYVQDWLEFPTGGFRGASWDETADVEYTFYGLGILALINSSK